MNSQEKPKTTIDDLEAILKSGKEYDIEIQSDGSIKAVDKGTANNAIVIPASLDIVSSY